MIGILEHHPEIRIVDPMARTDSDKPSRALDFEASTGWTLEPYPGDSFGIDGLDLGTIPRRSF